MNQGLNLKKIINFFEQLRVKMHKFKNKDQNKKDSQL